MSCGMKLSGMSGLQGLGESAADVSGQVAVAVAALQRLPQQISWCPEVDALEDRRRRENGRYLLPPADLSGREVLVVDCTPL